MYAQWAWAPEVTIRTDPPPAPGGALSLLAGLSVLFVAVVLLRRLLRGKRGSTQVFALSVSVGNALLDLAGMLQPDRANVESIEKAQSPGENAAYDEDVADGRRPRPEHRPGPPP